MKRLLLLIPFALSSLAIGPCANEPLGTVRVDGGGSKDDAGGGPGGSGGSGGPQCAGENPANACRGPSSCIPSGCGCSQDGWVCTDDCGGGRDCNGNADGGGGSSCGPVCLIFCQFGNVLDAAGCPTCRCNPAPSDCPPVCDIFCEYGNVLDPATACPTCACKPKPQPPTCDLVGCQNSCPYGYVPDATGCPTCRCHPTPPEACPAEKCTGPMPRIATTVCPDGTIAGPFCAFLADNTCGWTVRSCP